MIPYILEELQEGQVLGENLSCSEGRRTFFSHFVCSIFLELEISVINFSRKW